MGQRMITTCILYGALRSMAAAAYHTLLRNTVSKMAISTYNGWSRFAQARHPADSSYIAQPLSWILHFFASNTVELQACQVGAVWPKFFESFMLVISYSDLSTAKEPLHTLDPAGDMRRTCQFNIYHIGQTVT